MTDAKRCLFAGPYNYEFGHELFSWQGKVRELSSRYDQVYVCTKSSMNFLYEDFSSNFVSLEDYKEEDYPLCDRLRESDIQVKKGTGQLREKQKFIKYGTPTEEKYDLLIHARTKEAGMYSNLNNGIYDELFDELKSYKKIAFIGTKEESYCPDRAADLRGVGLSRLADVMASSSLVMGGSSGPIHFASLCGTPHLTWGGYRLRTFFRYAWDWNPFQVPCHIFENTSQMSYLKGRIKLWKNVPRNLLDLEHLNVVHSESYRQPTFKDLLHNINKILDE